MDLQSQPSPQIRENHIEDRDEKHGTSGGEPPAAGGSQEEMGDCGVWKGEEQGRAKLLNHCHSSAYHPCGADPHRPCMRF